MLTALHIEPATHSSQPRPTLVQVDEGRWSPGKKRIPRHYHTWKHHISTEDLKRRLGLDAADFSWRDGSSAGSCSHVARMVQDYSQLMPRRMLLCCMGAAYRCRTSIRAAPRADVFYTAAPLARLSTPLTSTTTSGPSSPPTASLVAPAMLRSGEPPPVFRAPPTSAAPCPSRSHGPSGLR